MSRVHINRLRSIRDDFEAARASVKYISAAWPQLHGEIAVRGLELKQFRHALLRMEETYMVRLFSEYEGMLREYLSAARPGRPLRRTPAEVLINSVALRLHINDDIRDSADDIRDSADDIRDSADDIRDSAHDVRHYRNALVHSAGAGAATVNFQDAVSALSHFLVHLP